MKSRTSSSRECAAGIQKKHMRCDSPPKKQPPVKRRLLPQLCFENIEDTFGQEVIIRRPWLEMDRSEPVHPAVELPGADALEKANFLRISPQRLHDIRPCGVLLKELRDQRRRMLEIAVHEDQRIALKIIQSGAKRRLLAESAGKNDGLHASVGAADFSENFLRSVF